MAASTAATDSSMVCVPLSTITSGMSGASYGSETPVKWSISPARASLVQPLDVTLREHVDGAVDIDLDEAADATAHLGPSVLVRRDRRSDRDHAVAREQLRDEADAADIDVAILFGESEPGTERLTDLVAVEDLDTQATIAKLGCDTLPDRRFAGTGETR